jgi:hypothetical protein
LIGSAPLALDEGYEVFDRDASLADERAQRALGDLSMVGNREPAVWRLLVAKDDVAATLAIELVSELAERRSDFAPRDSR